MWKIYNGIPPKSGKTIAYLYLFDTINFLKCTVKLRISKTDDFRIITKKLRESTPEKPPVLTSMLVLDNDLVISAKTFIAEKLGQMVEKIQKVERGVFKAPHTVSAVPVPAAPVPEIPAPTFSESAALPVSSTEPEASVPEIPAPTFPGPAALDSEVIIIDDETDEPPLKKLKPLKSSICQSEDSFKGMIRLILKTGIPGIVAPKPFTSPVNILGQIWSPTPSLSSIEKLLEFESLQLKLARSENLYIHSREQLYRRYHYLSIIHEQGHEKKYFCSRSLCLRGNLIKLLKQEVFGEEDYDFVAGLYKLVPAAHPFLDL